MMGMTIEERALKILKQMCSDGRYLGSGSYVPLEVLEDFSTAIKALEREPITNLGVDAVSRQAVDRLAWKYLRKPTDENVAFYEDFLALPSVTPQEPFMNKPCVSSQVCEHDKQKVLDKIIAEIIEKHLSIIEKSDFENGETYAYEEVLDIIDKYYKKI